MEPIDFIDNSDPGDDIQRRFHYQHAYGLILAIASILEKNDYVEFWYEHMEDILCKDRQNNYSYYQIKSRKAELGYWTLKDKDLLKSIKRFTKHEQRFGGNSERYCFVSNAEFKKSKDDNKNKDTIANSPINFFKYIYDLDDIKNCQTHFRSVVNSLLLSCDCTEDVLIKTLKKTELINGPNFESIDSELSDVHIHQLEQCKEMKLTEIHKIRDLLVNKIFQASSLIVNLSEKHLFNVVINNANNPIIHSKKITVDDFMGFVSNSGIEKDYFRFLPNLTELNIGEGKENVQILRKKLTQGGLENNFNSLQRRTLSTEHHLIELQIKEPENFGKLLGQVESVVLTECTDVQNMNTQKNEVDSVNMMKEVTTRMKEIAQNQKARVHSQNYDVLMGMVGLLSGACKIWWSKKFNLKDVK
ncbi:dsDNA nuclease domain-containing protein [Candidatus Omnitrophota bacterium]